MLSVRTKDLATHTMTEDPPRARPPPNRRRDKAQLSCAPCRGRKLKCDRNHPCGACARRGHIGACNYAKASSPSSASNTARQVSPQHSTSLHERISELETLVVTLIRGQTLPSPASSNSPRPSSVSRTDVLLANRRAKNSHREDASPADPGTLKLRDSGASYVESVHWEAILNKIRGLKQDFVVEDKAPLGSHLFYGPNRHATLDEILAAVPSRPDVDRLMAFQFESYFVTSYLIHSKKFLREYEAFWEDPAATSIAWIGLMFSMLYVAAQLQAFMVDLGDGRAGSFKAAHMAMKDAFREKAIQCLILARYTMGGSYILETLIMILTGEFILLKDSATDGWLFISTVLHIAMRMGYHRDSDHFPDISPFEGEMRRRIWTTILQLDLSLSLEMGLPRNATDTHMDTKEPRNLYDYDFDEDTTEMPPSRPETEWTPALALIARARLISALGLICDINTDTNLPSAQEVTRIDAILHDVHTRAIPPLLRWETIRHAITDSPNLVVQRVSVETTYYKARILLYRRALVSYQAGRHQERDTERDRESVRICLDSALKILSFQQMLHEESQPFGRLSRLKWKVNHIFNQDVLLATSVLCLYLQDIDKFSLLEDTGQQAVLHGRDEIRHQLNTSHIIWLQMSEASVEAGKVARALTIVLEEPRENEDAYASPSDGLVTDSDGIPYSMFSNQYVPSGYHSSIRYFDNVLEAWEYRGSADE